MINENLFYKQVGAKVRAARLANGLKQAELAKKLGVERTSITNIEGGKQKISLITLFQLVDFFKMEFSDFLPDDRKDLSEYTVEHLDKTKVVIGGKTHAAIVEYRQKTN